MENTKALISFAVTVKLICAFVFAYVDCWFSHAAAHMVMIKIVYSLQHLILVRNYNTAYCGHQILEQ